jgi:hypothetical protein
MHPATLQINVSPGDLNICSKLLERQISFWYNELDEILISVESKKSAGRFGLDFDENQLALVNLIESLEKKFPKVRHHFIDYSESRNKRLSNKYLGGLHMPEKDYRGGPFYCYFDGLEECRNRYVMHLDSDMILGGTPNSWIQDAIDSLHAGENIFFVNPFPGPPAKDFSIKQNYFKRVGNNYFFQKMSTRVFLVDRNRLNAYPLRPRKIRKTLKSLKWFLKNKLTWGYELPEIFISEMMEKNKLLRLDTAGKQICYTLHPLLKPKTFIDALPGLLGKLDRNEIPESQYGQYNIQNEFFDFKK